MNEAKKYAEQLKEINIEFKALDDEKFNGQGWFYFVNSVNDI